MNIKKTANLLLNFATKRIAELLGILISIGGVLLFIALMTYSPDDPNFIFPKDKEIKNLLGFNGSFVSVSRPNYHKKTFFLHSFGHFASHLLRAHVCGCVC